MPYIRFESRIPGGKLIDEAIAARNWIKAEGLLKRAEQDLTVRRRRRGESMRSLPLKSKQRAIDVLQIGILNKRIDAICETLRGKRSISILVMATAQRKRIASRPKPKRRPRTRRSRR